MPQANFAYRAPANDAAGLPLVISIYADRADIRLTLQEDAEATGFRIGEAAGIAALLDGQARALGAVVLLDCPALDPAGLAALARLDLRAAHAGAQLIVSTTVAALEDVFGCLDQSHPQILVDPTRAERMIALGRVLARFPGQRLREPDEAGRLAQLWLTEQVGQIARQLEDLPALPGSNGACPFRLESPKCAYVVMSDQRFERPADEAGPALPDPRLVRQIIRQRQLRARFFDSELFADPAWDMLLDLCAARAEHGQVSVTSLCIASGVPPTTALRWIGQMTEAGLLQRIGDESDRRRAFITLTEHAADAMARYFSALDCQSVRPV
jgi:hypothetical protein